MGNGYPNKHFYKCLFTLCIYNAESVSLPRHLLSVSRYSSNVAELMGIRGKESADQSMDQIGESSGPQLACNVRFECP